MINIGFDNNPIEEYIIDIRDKGQIIKARYAIDVDDIHRYVLMGDHYIQISFVMDRYVWFERGNFIEWNGAKFILREDYVPAWKNKYEIEYTLQFHSKEMLAQDVQQYYLNQDFQEVIWSLFSDARTHLAIFCQNMNRYFGTNEWVVGTVEPDGMQNISFDNLSAWNALTNIANAFKAEFYFTGTTVHLVKKVSYGSEIKFENETNVIIKSRSEGEGQRPYTRIVALGSSRNISSNYRGTLSGESVEAIYQKRLRIPANKGNVIDAYPNMSPEEVIEGAVVFEDIYPKRIGIMSDISTVEYIDTDEETGVETKWNAYRYKDTGLNFKEEYILPGQELRIYFQKSKRLSGLDFAVKYNPENKSESDPESQLFEIIRNENYGKDLPNETLYPEEGDEYILYGFDIQLVSNQYIPLAEKDLYDRALEWMKDNLTDKSVFEYDTMINHFAQNSMDLEIGQKIKILDDAFKDGYRSSRIQGFEKRLINKYQALYIVGDNATKSWVRDVNESIKELQVSGTIYQGTGGGSVYVIKQFDTTRPTDFNVYSAKASNAKFLKRDQEDTALRKITFGDGIDVKKGATSNVFGNETFTSGQFGSGFRMWQADNGQSYAEIDNIMVRREMIINTLTIAEIKSVGGQILVSIANMLVSKVEDVGESYRCFFDTDNGAIPNQFEIDDQAICRKFNGQNIKYYWRRVVSVGVDYIDLSKIDADGSSIPLEGDELIQFGNRINVNRQSAIMISAYGSDAPSIKQYAGINTYNLTDKEVTVISPSGNKFAGEFKISTNGTTSIVYKDRGAFNNTTVYYLNDRVSYNGAYWVCIAPESQSTSEIPSTTALYWRQDTTSQGDINNAIDDLEFGTRNLLLNSNKFKVGYSDRSQITSAMESDGSLRIGVNGGVGGSYTYFLINPLLNDSTLKDGDDITISYWMKAEVPSVPFNFYLKGGMGYYQMNGTLGTDYTQVYTTVKYVKAGELAIHISPATTGLFWLKYMQVEKGNKPSDWSPAPEDIQTGIIQAQTDADTAKVNADTANLLLADIANDNKFVPSEKHEVKREWDAIVSEYPKNISQASTFNVSSSAYTIAYNELNTYFTPLLSNLNVTSDIVGTTFRNTFKAYYDARLDLLNAIAKKAKDLADEAQNTANQAQTGVTEVKASLVVMNDKIESKVSQTDFNSLQGRVSTSESKIEQQAGLITSTVEKVDKKNAVYKSYTSASIDHPSVPYSKGDLWITYDGRILQTEHTRLTGSFITSDWKETVPSINDLEFGGRNLLLNSNKLKVGYSDNPAITSAMEADGVLRIGVVNGGIGGFLNSFLINPVLNDSSLQENDEITISYWMKCSGSATPFRFFLKNGMGYYNLSGTITTEYKQFSITVPYKKANTLSIHISPATTGLFWLKYMQVEKGNKPSDWSPATEDIQGGIDNAQSTADSKIRSFYSDTQPSAPSGGFKVGDLWYKINTVGGCYETYRWFGSGWAIINVNVSKSRIEQTDTRITSIVEKTGIDSLGSGETLYSKINQTAEQITLEVNKIQIGGGNLLLNSNKYKVGYGSAGISSAMESDGSLRIGVNGGVGGSYTYFLINPLLDDSTLKDGDDITISYWMKAEVPSVPFNFYLKGGMGYYQMNGTLGTDYTQVYATVKYVKAGELAIHISPIQDGLYWLKYIKIEKGNKPSDWSPATGDISNIVGSSLTLTDNKISLASTTIELKGTTIAKSIEAEDLKVGSRIGSSALEVLKDGTFYAKGSNGTNARLEIDSAQQSIKVRSPFSAGGFGNSAQSICDIDISSQTGGIRIAGATSQSNNSATVLSNTGIFSNTAGQPIAGATSVYANSKASLVGLGFANQNKISDSDFVAGVYGSASNKGDVPAFGGYFQMLHANGLSVSVKRITTTATLSKYDCYVSCYNTYDIDLYLPLNPYEGMMIFVRRVNQGGIRIFGNGKKIHTDGNESLDVWAKAGRGDTSILIYDGNLWMFNYWAR